MSASRKIYWLNLSGGGNRAAIYHFGVMHRLHEAGLLGDVVGISATSGGSIIAGAWARALGAVGGGSDVDPWVDFRSDCMRAFRRGLLAPAIAVGIARFLYVVSLLLFLLFSWLLAGAVFLTSLGVHAIALIIHVRDGALADTGWTDYEDAQTQADRHLLLRWLGRALASPSQSRILSLSLRMYHGMLLSRSSDHGVATFYNAIDLENGRQVVLSAMGMHAVSDHRDMEILFNGRTYNGTRFEGRPLLAEAVAASSAFPPVFKPVQAAVRRDGSKIQIVHLLDGGVTDNVGSKLFLGLLLAARREERRDGGIRPVRLDGIDVVVSCDGGKIVDPKPRVASRRKGLMRLMGVVQNAQSDEFFGSIDVLRALGLKPMAFGLQEGVPGFYEDDRTYRKDLESDEINRLLPRVRTHLDAFTIPEIVALAYCGYRQVGNSIGSEELPASQGFAPPRLGSLTAYARSFGWQVEEADVLKALKLSGRRLSPTRTMRVMQERVKYRV